MSESVTNRKPQSAIRLFAVIVIYKLRPAESPTLRTLCDAARHNSKGELELEILVWDNTPGGQDAGEIPDGVRYHSSPDNPGLARAYNSALEIAHADGFDWLLTLDQDSLLPTNFLVRIVELARTLQVATEIGAIVPQITGDGRNLSPFQFFLGSIPRWFRYGFVGTPQGATYALNSAATLRVTALRDVGGYDPMFPLDVSDINLFHRLFRAGKKVFVAGDLLISHDFSLLKKHRRMTMQRYNAMLLDECAFWDMNMGKLARAERMVRLAGRACKDLISPENVEFRKRAISELKRRMSTPRKQRIAAWQAWAKERSTPSARTNLSPPFASVDNSPSRVGEAQ